MGDSESSAEVYIPTSDAPVAEGETESGPTLDFDPDPPGADPDPSFYEPADAVEEDDPGGGDSGGD